MGMGGGCSTHRLDTTIISAYCYDGADGMGLARRLRIRDWWETKRPSFSTWISNVTEAELRDGVFPRQKECVKMARRIHHLPITRAAAASITTSPSRKR